MLSDFAPDRPGRHVYDLRPLCPDETGLESGKLVCINNGEGPRVLLCAGVHGDEYEPQVVVSQLAETIEAAQVRGRLIIVPTFDFPASEKGLRVAASDQLNMNRAFPGDAAGTSTQRLAAFMNDVLFPAVELVVDVHAGGVENIVVPMAFGFRSEACSLSEERLNRAMDDFGFPYVIHQKGEASTVVGAAPIAGVASIEIEGGGGTRLEPRSLDILRDALLRGLAAYGVLAASAKPASARSQHLEVGAEDRYHADAFGVLEHRLHPGDAVAAGDVLALIHRLADLGAAPSEIRAKRAGIVVSQRARVVVKPDDLLGFTGTPR